MAKAVKYKEADLPAAGSVFITRLADGRFGAVRVLDRKVLSGYDYAYVSPSPWIGLEPIRPSDDVLRTPLILTHHAWKSEHAGVWVSSPPPESFIPAGSIALVSADARNVREVYSAWESCSRQILIQWRWNHDREKLLLEDADRAENEALERQAQAARHAEMLRTTTLASVSTRLWFESWDHDIDGQHIGLSRAVISQLIKSLSEAPKITKTLAKRLLKAAVQDFNRLDGPTHFIETTHREDICEALELVMFAARQPDLVSQIDEWRDW